MGAESKEERLDRELIEFLNELRVALPGVQVLCAFLLGVPFTQRFAQVSDLQQDVYFLTFLCAAAATALLIAPSAYHRLQWRQGDGSRDRSLLRLPLVRAAATPPGYFAAVSRFSTSRTP